MIKKLLKKLPLISALAHVLIASVFVLTTVPAAYSITQPADEQTFDNQSSQPTTKAHISIERQNELTYMVRQDCGSCHGMTLKGGLGPSLLAERISVFPTQYLIDAVSHGRQGTPMPPWHSLLTQAEISWIVEQLQAGTLGHIRNNK